MNIIYAYGNSEYLFYIFDGIARIVSSNSMKIILSTASLMSFMYMVGNNATLGAEKATNAQLKWVMRYIIVTTFLLFPKSNIVIIDVVTGMKKKVSNVPLGLALPAGMINKIGHLLTVEFEKNFTPVNNLAYHKYGLVFGSQMISQMQNVKISDPRFWENMYNVIDKCVVYEAMIGTKYTIGDLKRSSNIWDLIQENASSFYSIDYRKESGSREIISCKTAVGLISKEWSRAYSENLNILGSVFTNNKNFNISKDEVLKNTIKSHLEEVSSFFAGIRRPAEDILRQQMMINAVYDVTSSYSTSRALNAQQATWITTGEIARETLPIMKAVLEAVIYSAFIFVVLLMLLPKGVEVFIQYLKVLFWLQMWAPLYAVLNMIMSLYGYHSTHNYFVKGFTLENFALVTDRHHMIAAMSGYFSAMIPFIAKAIMEGSASNILALANSLTSATYSAASTAAAEQVTGNYSLDNSNIGNSEYKIMSTFKSDYSSSFKGASMESILDDGSIEKVLGNGNLIMQSGAGFTKSTGATDVNIGEALEGYASKTITNAAEEREALKKEYASVEERAFNKSAKYIAEIAESISRGESVEISQKTEEGKILQKAVEHTIATQKTNEVSFEEASKVAITASAGVPSIVKGITSLDASIALSREKTKSTKTTSASLEETSHKDSTIETQQNLNSITNATTTNNSKSMNKALVEDLTNEYKKINSVLNALEVNTEKTQRFEDMLSKIQKDSLEFSHDAYDDMQKWLMNKGVSIKEAQNILDSGGLRFKEYFKEFADQYMGELSRREIMNNIKTESIINAKNQFEEVEINDQGLKDDALQKAKQEGVNFDALTQDKYKTDNK